MNHEEFLKKWEKDSRIDPAGITDEIVRIPKLHSEYLLIKREVTLAKNSLDQKFIELRVIKISYYSGELTKEELSKYGWNQFQKIATKSGIEALLLHDPDLSKITSQITLMKDFSHDVDMVLKEISNRNWLITNLVNYAKLMSGA